MDSEDIHLYLHNSQANGEAARPRQLYRKKYNMDNTATRYSQDLPVQPGYNFRSSPNMEPGSQNQRNSPYKQLPYQQTYPQSVYPQNMYPPNSYSQATYPQASYPYNTYPQSMYPQRPYPSSQISQYRAQHAAQPYASPYGSPNAYAPSSCGSKLLFGCSPQVQQIPCTTAGQYQPMHQYDPYQQYRSMAADNEVKPFIPESKPNGAASADPTPENANKPTTNGQTELNKTNTNNTPTTELNNDKNAKTNNSKPEFDLSRFGVPSGRASTPEFPTPPPSGPCTNSANNQGIQFPSSIPRIPAYSPSYLVPAPPPAAPKSTDGNSTDSNSNVATSLNSTSETPTPKSDDTDKLPTTPEHIVGSTHMGSYYNPADKLITTPSHLLQQYPSQLARPTYAGASNYFQKPGVITTPNHLLSREPYPIYRPHTPNYNISPGNHPGAWN